MNIKKYYFEEDTMKRSVSILTVFIVTSMLGGCIISKTPTTNDVAMHSGDQMNFSVKVFPNNATYAWTLDGSPLLTTESSFLYNADAGEHILIVKAKHIFVTDTQTWNITVSPPYAIGDTGPAGGWIFYDKGSYSDGWRYLEAAPSDQSSDGIQWYNGSNIETGATGTEVGTGKTNTTLIVNAQGDGSYAAKLCDDLSITNNGVSYDDWFLPSIDELNLIYQNLYVSGISDFVYNYYWSSSETVSEDGPQYASILLFYGTDGTIGWTSKSAPLPVRAARAF
jgi:hypothetical protein